jgi:hypothetical protein
VYIRTQALQMVFRLLQGNAEQEQNLLRLGVNKLVRSIGVSIPLSYMGLIPYRVAADISGRY